MRAPRAAPKGTAGHVIFSAGDETVKVLGKRLTRDGVP